MIGREVAADAGVEINVGLRVGALAWSQLGAPGEGLINRLFRWATGAGFTLIDIYTPAGIIFVEAIFEAPVAVLIIGTPMQRIDPAPGDAHRLQDHAAIEAVELDHMLTTAGSIVEAALARTESRGAHQRVDFPQADDVWLKHVSFRAAADGGLVREDLPIH